MNSFSVEKFEINLMMSRQNQFAKVENILEANINKSEGNGKSIPFQNIKSNPTIKMLTIEFSKMQYINTQISSYNR